MKSSVTPLKTSAASENLDQDIDALRKDFASLKDNVSALMAHVGSLAGEKADEGVQASKAMAGQAKDGLEDARETVENKIREKPLAAIGIAAGVGALLALASRK